MRTSPAPSAGSGMEDLRAVASALALAPAAGEPDPLLYAVDVLAQRLLGHRLFTVLRYDVAAGLAHRLYSSAPEIYPASGSKRIATAPALQRMVETGQPLLTPDAAAVRRNFPDAEAIFALGCASVLNLPVIVRGRLLGQVNLLHQAGHYTASAVEDGMVLTALAAPALLMESSPIPADGAQGRRNK
ncbi:GAF domain-containing protein [Bordetella sputigena]|uniref:GAF domain-containing protein n=1 Tax=Bordetella sputigena TaxID=1416810 RepID=UPI0039F09C5F